MTDAELNTTEWFYTPLGRLDRLLYPPVVAQGPRQTVNYPEYDGNGRPTEVQYRQHNSNLAPRLTWNLFYDELGRLTRREAALTNVPQPGSPGAFEFFGTTSQDFIYDDLGRLIQATDTSASDFSGADITTTRSYDSAGRALEENLLWPVVAGGVVTFPNHKVKSEYDLTSFRTKLTFPDDGYSITYEPDSRGRTASIYAPNDPNDGTQNLASLVQYEYIGSQVWRRSYRNGAELQMVKIHGRGYDALGRALSLRTVDAANPENVITDFRFGYDRIGNRTFEQRRHELMSPLPSNGTFRTRAYTTDPMGRLTHWTEGALGFDPEPADPQNPAGMLAQPTDAESWTLDLLGNWEARSRGVGVPEEVAYTPNALNQYEEVTPEGETALAFNHDWLGQMREDASKGGRKYIWDAFGRLTKVTQPIVGTCNGAGTCNHDASIECSLDSDCTEQTIGRYRYDAMNRRVEKYAPLEVDKTTRYVYDGWRAIEERAVESTQDGQNQTEVVRARFGFGLTLDGVLWMDRDVARDGQGEPDPFYGIPSGSVESRFFVHHDLLGSAVALTADDPCVEEDPPCESPVPAVAERYTYSAYGEATAWWDPTWLQTGYAPTSAHTRSKFGLPYLYTGQRLDSETGLHYYKNRFLDPTIGRFLRRDPIGYSGGLALYEYANSNPAIASDPLGLESIDEHWDTTITAGHEAGAPPEMITEVAVANKDRDTNPFKTVWSPTMFVMSIAVGPIWIYNAPFHGLGTTTTEKEFADKLRSLETNEQGGDLAHLIQDDGIDEDGVHGGYGALVGHFFGSIWNGLRGKDPVDQPSDPQQINAVSRTEAIFQALMWNQTHEAWEVGPIQWTDYSSSLFYGTSATVHALQQPMNSERALTRLESALHEVLYDRGLLSLGHGEEAKSIHSKAVQEYRTYMATHNSISGFGRVVPISGSIGTLERSMQGSRVNGGRMEAFRGGVRSMDGGGFSGLDGGSSGNKTPGWW